MKDLLKSVSSALYFVVVLLIVHFVWRSGFRDGFDLSGNEVVTFYGGDVTAFFSTLSAWLTSAVYGIISTCTSVAVELKDSSIYLASQETSIKIVWNCTGVKQIAFFIIVVLLYPKRTWHKAWFIPAGIIFLFLVNILRITTIIYFCDADINRFDMLHEGSKYIYYGIIFIMWIIWDWKVGSMVEK